MQLLILASASSIRAKLLTQAGVDFQTVPARVDEAAVRDSLMSDGASPRDIADTLAEFKAKRVSQSRPEALVLGCDQILEFSGQVLGKPGSLTEARERLTLLSGQTHSLFSAAVLYDQGRPVWRFVAEAKLTMRALSPAFLDWYIGQAGPEVLETVGGYAVEGVGIRLFDRIEGDLFGILGLPLLPLLNALTQRGDILA